MYFFAGGGDGGKFDFSSHVDTDIKDQWTQQEENLI